MHDELFILVSKDGTPVQKLFWTQAQVEQHLDELGAGKGTEDNEHLRNRLEVKRYVIATMEAA